MLEQTVFHCSLVELTTTQGNHFRVVNAPHSLTFDVQRIYYIYDLPCGSRRGAHAHKELEQLMIAVNGSFDLVLDDARSRRRISLDRPDQAVHVVPGIWREMENFSVDAVCLVLASQPFDEGDYIRDYDSYVKARRKQ